MSQVTPQTETTPQTQAKPASAPARNGGVKEAKKASSLPTLSRYRIAFYCSRCARWLLHEEAVFDRSGRPRCPRCGSPLRTKPIWKVRT